jgi:hypothetical protein
LNTDSSTFAPVDATAGVSIALTLDNANVQSLLNGTITAGGTISGGKLESFDPTQNGVVNLTTGVINVPGIAGPGGLTNGEQVVYQANNSTLGGNVVLPSNAMGGLTNGATYSVIVIDKDDIQLALVPSIQLDPSATDPTSTQTFSVPSADTFSIDAIDPSADTVRLVNHGFNDGDTVQYSANGNTPIQGLTDGATYKVQVVDATLFKLLDSNGNVIPISQGNALGLQTFTDLTIGAAAVGLILASIDTTNNAIVLPNSELTNGESVTYASLEADGNNPIGGLTDQNAYTIQTIPGLPNEFQLVDPTPTKSSPSAIPAPRFNRSASSRASSVSLRHPPPWGAPSTAPPGSSPSTITACRPAMRSSTGPIRPSRIPCRSRPRSRIRTIRASSSPARRPR